MSRKPKFKPVLTRVKLNPEQAVLSCNCYTSGQHAEGRFGGTNYWGTSYGTGCYSRPTPPSSQGFISGCCFSGNTTVMVGSTASS